MYSLSVSLIDSNRGFLMITAFGFGVDLFVGVLGFLHALESEQID